MTKRLIITKETHEIFFLRQIKRREIEFCGECRQRVLWISTSEAADFSNISEFNIFRQIEKGTFHFRETRDGMLLICFESISAKKLKN